ncbi:MAG: hypothetical protein FD127_3172 [Acidimicrobiaceae bacterium]|nr:MAG: hypothetical protein FD127_3172 [Acidimicrobiaceae bacterium]
MIAIGTGFLLVVGCGEPGQLSSAVPTDPVQTTADVVDDAAPPTADRVATGRPDSVPVDDVQDFLNPTTSTNIAAVFKGRYQLPADEVQLVVISATDLDRITGSEGQIEDEVLVAFVVGDLTDSGAHPPAGNELPTGRVGYVVVLRGGELLGGGLLSADRSAELISASRTVVGPLAGLTEH